MIRELALKPDFARTIDRFDAWWRGELLDRPPVTVNVRPAKPARAIPAPGSPEQKWLDVDYVVESAIADLERRVFPGDTMPVFWPNVGPEITACLFGCELEFGPSTSWSRPIIHDSEQWTDMIERGPDFSNRYWQVVEQLTQQAVSLSNGRYIVGLTDLHGNYDILAAMRDPQYLCLDMLDCPDLVRKAGRVASAAYVQAFERLYSHVAQAGMGSTTWCNFYHPGPAYVTSCDFWCLVSDSIVREIILPDVIHEMRPLERNLFHLDGPQALRHLDILLEMENLDAVQWVYGSGNGRAEDWIDVYRRIRAAGKSAHVYAEDPRDALAVLEAVGPEGLWLQVGPEIASAEEADAFIADVERLTRRHRPVKAHQY